MKTVISLCDLTGHMVLPWAEAGYECYVFDIQHPYGVNQHKLHHNIKMVGGSIMVDWVDRFLESEAFEDIKIAFAFPPCTDLTGSGSRWWASKGENAYIYAMAMVSRCRDLLDGTGVPWMLENPPGRINSGSQGLGPNVAPHPARWKEKWNHRFQPFQYGGYDDIGKWFWDHHGAQLWRTWASEVGQDPSVCLLKHAKAYTAWLQGNFDIKLHVDSDGYHKSTCLWTGNGFVMPEIKPIGLHAKADKVHKCSPGKERANIRSATPMGFARAVYTANN